MPLIKLSFCMNDLLKPLIMLSFYSSLISNILLITYFKAFSSLICLLNELYFCCLKVQPPFDTASYYAQFYRPGPDSDGRVSPFVSPGVASKFNGNVTVMPPHSSQTMQEVSTVFGG